ncbi:hypothetical protein HY025_03295 [Candidatus Daviesbacteria bacterium]|nr:hypothetical protein [Candidatus Daviesbacteria bacterium]
MKIFRYLIVQFLSIGVASFIFLFTKSNIFTLSENIWVNVIAFFLTAGLIVITLWILKSTNKKIGIFIFWFFWIVLSFFVIFSLPHPSIYDYGFYLGPALKLAQGEKLGTFYMQYGLGLTYIFKLMIVLHMKASQMQVTLACFLIFWFGLYYVLVTRLIKDKILLFLFMLLLIILRYFAVLLDPTAIPAISPIRIDLWVLLALCVFRFGFQSIITSGLFAAIYIFDDTFGFFYLCIYLLFFCALSIRNFNLKKLIPIIFPFLSLVWHFSIFGSLSNMAVKFYQSTNLGFKPITLNSPFWIIIGTLPYFLWILLKEENKNLRVFYFFLLSVAFSQLVYFFGRSDDNNLTHISGIFVLILFISLNIVRKKYKLSKIPIAFIIILLSFSSMLFVGDIERKILKISTSLTHHRVENISPEESFVNDNPHLLDNYNKDKLIIITESDSYYNYQYGLKQLGYYSPFPIHLYVDETINYLVNYLNQGYKLIFLQEETAQLIEQLNRSKKMKSLGLQFKTIDKGNLVEVELMQSSILLEKTYEIDKLINFKFPQTWRLQKILEDEVVINDLTEHSNMYLQVSDQVSNPNPAVNFVDLKDRNKIRIVGAEKILGVPSQINGQNAFIFLVFKDKKQLAIGIWPVDNTVQLNRFLSIINSIEFK